MTWHTNLPRSRTKLADAPEILIDNWTILEEWAETQHFGVDVATLSGEHRQGRSSIMMVGTSSVIAAIPSPPGCAVAFDTSFNVLKYYNGSAWINLGGLIESGTVMVFWQDTAPTGWTIKNLNDKVLYITKGGAAGGQTGGGVHSTGTWTWSHVHATNPCAIDNTMLPAHQHNMGLTCGASGLSWQSGYPGHGYTTSLCADVYVTPTGGGQPHTHGQLGADSPNTWRFACETFILCEKD